MGSAGSSTSHGGTAHEADASVHPLEQEHRDLAVGPLLVLRVRRPGLDRVVPPLAPLLAGQQPHGVGVPLGSVLELDLGAGEEVVVPLRVVVRPALRGDRDVLPVALDPHHRVLPQEPAPGADRGDHYDRVAGVSQRVGPLSVGLLVRRDLVTDPLLLAGGVDPFECHARHNGRRGSVIPSARPRCLTRSMDDMWSVIAAERGALADDLAPLDENAWDTPSLCEKWTVRDAVAHMVATAEMTPPK